MSMFDLKPVKISVVGRTFDMRVPYSWDEEHAKRHAADQVQKLVIIGEQVLAAQGVVERAEGEARTSSDPMAVVRLLEAQAKRAQVAEEYRTRRLDLKNVFHLEV